MVSEYRLTLRPDRDISLSPEDAYRLYAALLSKTSTDFADRWHQNATTPVSQFLVSKGGQTCWTVHLLGEESEHALSPVLENEKHFFLEKHQTDFTVESCQIRKIAHIEDLFAEAKRCSGRHLLQFQTATAFKRQGKYCNFPDKRLILQSLIKTWNGCFPDCYIEDEDGRGLDALTAGISCSRFCLRDSTFYLKGHPVAGFCGRMVLENQLSGFHRQITDALLIFSGYAGIGVKTALGMGGVEHRFL